MFTVSHERKRLIIRFAATPGNIERAAEYTRLFLDQESVREACFDILLVMREALTNAVRHGCRCNLERTVSYGLRLEGAWVTMEVEDEGEGFDWRAALARIPEASADRGYGLTIMKQYSTELTYNQAGNRLTIRKFIGSDGRPDHGDPER